MTSLRYCLVPLVALCFLFVGCDEGPVGPRGPQGPVGPPGSASVVSFDAFFEVATAVEGENGLVLSSDYDAPEITSDVLTNGLVMAYFLADNNTYTAMPYTYGENRQGVEEYTLTFGYAFDVDFLQLFYEGSRPAALDFAVDRDVRVVVLEGDPFSSAAASAKSSDGRSTLRTLQRVYPEVDWTSYEAVADHFGLEK